MTIVHQITRVTLERIRRERKEAVHEAEKSLRVVDDAIRELDALRTYVHRKGKPYLRRPWGSLAALRHVAAGTEQDTPEPRSKTARKRAPVPKKAIPAASTPIGRAS